MKKEQILDYPDFRLEFPREIILDAWNLGLHKPAQLTVSSDSAPSKQNPSNRTW